MPTRTPTDNQLPPTDLPPLIKEAVVITFWTGVARFLSIPLSWIPWQPLRWPRQTMAQGDELLLLCAIMLLGVVVTWISFSGYLARVRQTPWQTLCVTLSYLMPFTPGTAWLIHNGGNAMVWILTNLNYIAHQRSEARGRAEGEARGEARGRAEGEARGRAEERAELLDQLVREGVLTPEQRAEKEAQRRADNAAQNSNHGRE